MVDGTKFESSRVAYLFPSLSPINYPQTLKSSLYQPPPPAGSLSRRKDPRKREEENEQRKNLGERGKTRGIKPLSLRRDKAPWAAMIKKIDVSNQTKISGMESQRFELFCCCSGVGPSSSFNRIITSFCSLEVRNVSALDEDRLRQFFYPLTNWEKMHVEKFGEGGMIDIHAQLFPSGGMSHGRPIFQKAKSRMKTKLEKIVTK